MQRGQAVGSVLSGDAALIKRLNDSQKDSGFDASKGFTANINKFESAIGALNVELIGLSSAAEAAAKKVAASQNELHNAQAAATMPQSDYAAARSAYGEY